MITIAIIAATCLCAVIAAVCRERRDKGLYVSEQWMRKHRGNVRYR